MSGDSVGGRTGKVVKYFTVTAIAVIGILIAMLYNYADGLLNQLEICKRSYPGIF